MFFSVNQPIKDCRNSASIQFNDGMIQKPLCGCHGRLPEANGFIPFPFTPQRNRPYQYPTSDITNTPSPMDHGTVKIK